MTGLLARLFGRRGAPSVAGHDPDGGKTKKVSQVRASEQHVQTIHSGQLSSVAEPKQAPADRDTGPWFIGKTVGEIYQIRGVLGRGGMGIVYRGYDTATHREVAVKLPLGKFVDDEKSRKRFALEDIDSTNGTYVNGFQLPRNQPHRLGTGDLVRLSNGRPRYDLLVHYVL